MISKIKKPVSILLSLIMVFSLFTIVPFSASAAVGDVLSESEYLTFTAVEAGSSVTLKYTNGTLQYKNNNSDWASYTAGTQIALSNVGDSVRFRGKNTIFDYSNHVSIGGKVACSGNVMSLRLDDNGKDQGLSYGCFTSMFRDCTGLTAAPKLPETKLMPNCYSFMFYRCTSLTTAPALPATMLAANCYTSMFNGCMSLTTAPELPATTLAPNCYTRMFNGCKSLTTAPELPATTLVSYCYSNMFYDCESLTTAPELPATTLADNCYNNMFYYCKSLTAAPELPATTLAPNCYYCMFYGCSSIKLSETQTAEYSIPYSVPSGGNGTTASLALDSMFSGTGGTFTGTPEINKTYYMYVPAPAPTTYTITDASVNGTVTASVNGTNVTEAEENADVTLTVAPAEGYQFVSISAGDVSLTTVTEGSQYSFTMPKKPVTVTAVFEEIPAPELPDVIKDCTYYDSYCGFYANVPFAGMFSDIQNGAIICDSYSETDKSIMDTKDYSYKFYDENGTELQAENIYHDDSADGYGFRVIMNVFRFSNPISGPLYIVATAPAPAKLIAGHTLSLDGNIAINFYLDPSAAGLTAADVNSGNLSYSFAWVDQADTKAKVDVAEQARQSQAFTVSDDGKYIIVTCHVCAAEMTCGINASFTLGNKTESEVYSVRKYGDSVLNPTEKWLNDYKSKYPDNSRMCYGNLKKLVEAMLHYGAMAQTVFGINKGYLANKGLSYNMLSDTPDFDEAIQTANRRLADNLASADFFGENFKAPSLVFLDYSTLKLYFENKDGSLSTSGLTPWNNYFYIKHENIAASELDTLQTFTVSGKTFRYSALDYAKVLAASENTDNANLAKALYWYNKAANAYFG